MEQVALYYCGNCERKKPWKQFKLRKKDDQYGRKGELTSRCLCAEKQRNRHQNKKQKRDEEDIDPSGDPEEHRPALPVEQFTALLRELRSQLPYTRIH